MTGNIQKMAEALWNLATKEGGLKPADKRGAFLLFLTWIQYVIGGVCGAGLAQVCEADRTQPSLSPSSALSRPPRPLALSFSRPLLSAPPPSRPPSPHRHANYRPH